MGSVATVRPAFTLLSVVSNIERHKLASDEPWRLLLDLQYPGAANPGATQQHVRLVRDVDPITFDANDGNGPQEYTPFNFNLGDYSISTTGSYPQVDIKVSNVMRVIQTMIEQYGGLVDSYLTLYCVNAANPSGEPELTINFTIRSTQCDAQHVTFKCGASSPLRRLFPLLMYRPNYCGWQYKSAQCGYVDPAPFTGTVTSGSATITALSSTAQVYAGQAITGAGIPAGATIATVTPSTSTLTFVAPASATATASGTAVALAASFPSPGCSKTIDGAIGCKAHFPNQAMRALLFPGIDSNGASVAGVV